MQSSFLEDVSFSSWKVSPGRIEEFYRLARGFPVCDYVRMFGLLEMQKP